MKKLVTTILILSSYLSLAQSSWVLINNVQILNGKDEKSVLANVLVTDNIITKISTGPIMTNKSGNTKIIDGKGKYLIPGLIDNHVHLAMNTAPQEVLLTLSMASLDSLQRIEGNKMLLRGFTTIRDLGGPVFTAKKDFDKGTFPGPRIYPSGAMISQTSGHGDARMPYEKSKHYGGEVSKAELMGVSYIADGVPEVLNAVRESLRSGASQIKVHAGGGAATLYDPLDVSQYTFEELKAAVDAAEDWGTYVCVHAYTSRAVKRSIEAGVKVIEHGQLLDDETLKLMADKGIFLSLQALDPAPPQAPETVKVKKQQVIDGTDLAFRTAKKYNIKILWGTDYLFDPKSAARQSTDILKLKKWFTPFEMLKLITYDNAKVFELSGERNPYQKGKLGEISEGAYADMILVDGNPMKNIDLLASPEKNFVLIMKDGVIYKNTIVK
ncbi:amidohydrolase family protein [Flavobacterium sp. RSB2_4_14]|uniref:metal-dependent hydrolase family protein n=1 Tax=Flavobacterium sp. RSB2_4_14 TaxID=3447665 RepID=UPI003F3D209A